MKKGRLLLSEDAIKRVRFDTGYLTHQCINTLVDEGYIDVPMESVERLIEQTAVKVREALHADERSLSKLKIALLQSQEFEATWRPKERCLEYSSAKKTLGVIESYEGEAQVSPLLLVMTLKKISDDTSRHIAIARQYRTEATLYIQMEPIFREVIDIYMAKDDDADELYSFLKIILRDELMELSEKFIKDAMQKITFGHTS